MQELEFWEATTNSDMEEGRGSNIVRGRFKLRQDAEKAVKGKGPWGHDGNTHHKRITVFDTYKEFEDASKAELKQSAIDKLSPEEREALGL